MGLGDGLKTLRGTIGKALDKVLGAEPTDSEATVGANTEPPMGMAEAEEAAAGLPPDMR